MSVNHALAGCRIIHCALKTPFWLIEDNDWQLELGSRTLRFIFTPYLHFLGAFCTFDIMSKILFSSDLFGAFSDDWSLDQKDMQKNNLEFN